MILDKIVQDVKMRLDEKKHICSFDEMKNLAHENKFYKRQSFLKAMEKECISIIAEVKKGSPSKGIISHDFPYEQIAAEYEAAGVSAVSVLTEQDNFFGNTTYLQKIKKCINIPVFRKDFIVDEYQIYESAAIGADALLLIAAILETDEIAAFMKLAKEFQMDCLVEIHDESELKKALAADAKMIGVNNRDLKTFHVDLNQTIKLRKLIPPGKVIVSESGIQENSHIQMIRNAQVDAVLIGEAFMRSDNKALTLQELMRE